MTNHAILIAVEEYADSRIANVPYARRDAEAFSQALSLHGFDEAEQTLLIDGAATKSVVATQVGQVLTRLQREDSLIVFYAGHGFSQGGKSYLACHDSQESDSDGSCLELASLLAELQTADFGQVAFFLDIRGIDGSLRDQELKSSCDNNAHCICFASCSANETSHSSAQLRQGVWAYHVIEAFRGDAPLALDRGILTANSLQNYLQAEVPRTLRNESPNPNEQTPWMYGAASEEVMLADIRQIREERRERTNTSDNLIAGMLFTVVNPVGLRSLSGWKKSHRIPESYSESTESFVISCAADELAADLNDVYDKLKKSFGFKRRELTATEPEEGSGSIITPYFNYSVHVTLNPEELDEVTWTRTVEAIKVPEQITSGAFADVFDDVFDTLEFALPVRINVEDFIDAAEESMTADVTIEYDRQATYCELRLNGADGSVTVTADTLSIVHDLPTRTQRLMDSFDTVCQFVQKHNLPLVAFMDLAK